MQSQRKQLDTCEWLCMPPSGICMIRATSHRLAIMTPAKFAAHASKALKPSMACQHGCFADITMSLLTGADLEAHEEVAKGGGAGDGVDAGQHHDALLAAAGQPEPFIHPAARWVLVCPPCQPVSCLPCACMRGNFWKRRWAFSKHMSYTLPDNDLTFRVTELVARQY